MGKINKDISLINGAKIRYAGSDVALPTLTQTALTGTLTGTANSAMVDIAAAAGACAGSATPSAANVDTAIATAVATIVTGTNEQLKELQTQLNAARVDIAALKVALAKVM